MIPRAARRCRRLYSAQALAVAPAPVPNPHYLPYLAHHQPKTVAGPSMTVLPTPLPQNTQPLGSDPWYTDSPTQELLAVIGACIQHLYDVPRAKGIFDRLREQNASSVLEPKVYDGMLGAYLAKADGTSMKEYWFKQAALLYDIMESGEDKVLPTTSTYAMMLLGWIRHSHGSEDPIRCDIYPEPVNLLSKLIEREISVPHVVADQTFTNSKDASDALKLLSKAAVDLNMSKVVTELGMIESIGQNYNDPLEGVPEVRPVLVDKAVAPGETAGEAIRQEIPFNLLNLRTHLANVAFARRVLPAELTARQKLLEESVYDVAVQRLKHEAGKFAELGLASNALRAPDLQKWMWDWHVALQARLTEAIKDIVETEREAQESWEEVQAERRKTSKAPSRRSKLHPASAGPVPLAPFLQLVKPERLSLITILELMRLQGTGGVSDGMKTTRALLGVGRSVEVEYKAQMSKRNHGNISSPGVVPSSGIDDISSIVKADPGSSTTDTPIGSPASQLFGKYRYGDLYNRRQAARKFIEDSEQWTGDWTHELRVKIGSILVECLMDVAEVERTKLVDGKLMSETQPAFFHCYEYLRGQKLGVIRLNPFVAQRIAKDGLRETLHPRHLPMLVRPKPWLGHDNGGYIYNKTSAMRFKDSVEQLAYLKHASELGNVELVYAGLDVLGSTPWRINRPVFDVVLQVWNSGERLGKMPPATYDAPEPERPEVLDGTDDASDLRVRNVYQQRHRAWQQSKANNHSERCSVNYKIEIARAFLGDTIYLPHNLDFRGRAYPIPPHLNHIGDDLSRGILRFADAKPLGDRGLRWLKIHLANLYGFDKANFDERVDFVMERLDDVYDSATNPLGGRRWWTKADDPWQCLATCIELHAALTSPDPLAYESSLPVHQDGTCNGLQHYAALGGDARGAAQVNLAAADRPSDVYTYVGNMVEQMLAKDAEKGEPLAIKLMGKISRKVVKQTVMTTVYGVTFIGAREQIEKQLKDRKDLPEEECWTAAAYLAKQVLACIGDLFSGAKGIQTWLNLCARLVSKALPAERVDEALSVPATTKKKKGKPVAAMNLAQIKKEQMTSVVWTTPLGLPIVQPYRKPKRKQISTAIQTVYISDPNSPAEVNSVKQASAFPPNFIHSLDATHMILTALECRTQALTFASVHDSYWTHACSIDKMSEIIRDTFIALHSSDVLGKLKEEFVERYQNYKIPLSSLQSPQLVKRLKDAGVRLVVPTEAAAAALGPLSDLAVLASEAEASGTPVKKPRKSKGSKASEDPDSLMDKLAEEDESMEEDEDDEELSKRQKALKIRKDKEAAKTEALLGKFINLVDILPPLPEKGDFNVEAIKTSQYFFS